MQEAEKEWKKEESDKKRLLNRWESGGSEDGIKGESKCSIFTCVSESIPCFHHSDQSMARRNDERRQTVNMNNKQIESGAPFAPRFRYTIQSNRSVLLYISIYIIWYFVCRDWLAQNDGNNIIFRLLVSLCW